MFLLKNAFFSVISNKTATAFAIKSCFTVLYFAAGLMIFARYAPRTRMSFSSEMGLFR